MEIFVLDEKHLQFIDHIHNDITRMNFIEHIHNDTTRMNFIECWKATKRS